MQFGPGLLGGEPPVNGRSRHVAFFLVGTDGPSQGILIGVVSPETGPGQHAELDLCHPFDKLRTGLSQRRSLSFLPGTLGPEGVWARKVPVTGRYDGSPVEVRGLCLEVYASTVAETPGRCR